MVFAFVVCAPAQGPVFTATTNLQSIPIQATDRQGNPVSGLTASDFTLLEDGRPQKIAFFAAEHQPVSLAILMDASRGMDFGGKLDRARAAIRTRNNENFTLSGSEGEAFDPKLIEVLDPERVLLARERLGEVMTCLDELGPRTKNMFILFRLEGMRQKDIAACYGVSLSTVEKYVTTAIIHLAKRFGCP